MGIYPRLAMPSDMYLRSSRTSWEDSELQGFVHDGRSDGKVPVLFFDKPKLEPKYPIKQFDGQCLQCQADAGLNGDPDCSYSCQDCDPKSVAKLSGLLIEF